MNILYKPSYVYFFFFGFYLLTLANNFSSAADGIDYLKEFETENNLLQSNHLLYHISTYGVFRLLQLLLPWVANNYLIESINAAWGAGILTIFYQFLKNRYMISVPNAFITTLVPAFSYGLWFYSINIEVYMPPLFCVMVALYHLTKPNPTKRDLNISILFHVLAILFHLLNFLFTPVIIWFIWNRRNQFGFAKSVLRYALAGGGTVLIVLFLTGILILGLNDKDSLIHWLKGHANSGDYWFPLSITTLENACVGFMRTFIGAHFIFKIQVLENYMNQSFFYHNLADEIFLVRNISEKNALLLTFLSTGILLMILYILFSVIFKFNTILNQNKRIIIPVVLTFVFYAAFFFFFLPQNVELWITQMLMFWLLLLGCWLSLPGLNKKSAKVIVSILAGLLLVVNYFGSIKWVRDINNDYYYVKVKEISHDVGSEDLIILQDKWPIESYVQRYSETPVILLPEQGDKQKTKETNEMITRVLDANGKVVLSTDKSFMHSIENQPYIDSLIQAHIHQTDTVTGKVSNRLMIRR